MMKLIFSAFFFVLSLYIVSSSSYLKWCPVNFQAVHGLDKCYHLSEANKFDDPHEAAEYCEGKGRTVFKFSRQNNFSIFNSYLFWPLPLLMN